MQTRANQVDVPAAIHSKLLHVQRRERAFDCAAGLIGTATAFLVAMLVAMLLDWKFTFFNPNVRVILTGVSLAVGIVLLAAWVAVPFARRKPLSDVAIDVDEAVPNLEERWSTVAELADSADPPAVRGADALVRQVKREAEAMAHLVEPEHVAPTARVMRPARVLLAVGAVLLLAFLFDPAQGWVLFKRFCAPRTAISLTQVTSLVGDGTVPRGEPLDIAARLDRRKRETATVQFEFDRGQTRSVTVPVRQQDSDGSDDKADILHKLVAVEESFNYRIRSGDGQTPWHRITVADRPELVQVEFRIAPPEYSRLPEQHETALPGRARALAESVLEVGFRADQPLEQFELRFDDDGTSVIEPDEAGWYRYRTRLEQTMSLSPVFVSQHGLENRRPPVCRIEVYADRPPTVRVENPGETVAVRPDDTLNIHFQASDDLGIAKAELVVYGDPLNAAPGDEGDASPRELQVIDIPIDNAGEAKTAQGEIALDLKPFELQHGAELRYAVRVFDTKNVAASGSEQLPHPEQQPSETGGRPASQQQSEASQTDEQTARREHDQQPSDTDREQSEQDRSSQATGESTQLAAKPGSRTDEQAQQPSGAPKPPDNRTKRLLDVAGQCTACRQRRIVIDEWADSFAGQTLEKLQLAIDPYLSQLDQLLAAAEELTGQPVTEPETQSAWNDARTAAAERAQRHVSDGLKIVDRLESITAETPYAFIGLQLVDIAQSHVLPAEQHLSGIPKRPDSERSEELAQAHFHIVRARELLARLTRQYEAVKQSEQLAEKLEHIKKMHQLFIEGTFQLLGSKKPLLNPKQRAFLELELDEEFLNKLRELLERKRDIQAELAKALAKDPRLLKRFMARTRLEGTTLRDQLTLLAGRQRTLHSEVSAWRDADPQSLEEIAVADLRARQTRDSAQIAEQAAAMSENFVTWIPLDLDPSSKELAALGEGAAEVATIAVEFARVLGLGEHETARQLGRKLYDKLHAFQQALPESADPGNERLAVHYANRLLETRQLITATSGWLHKEESITDGRYHRAAQVDQHELTSDTAELVRKLDNLNAWLAGMPEHIGELAGQLNETLVGDLIPEQMSAEQSLEQNVLATAAVHQHRATEQFAVAEKQMDELMDEIIAYLDSQPAGGKPNLDDFQLKSLEELLAMLEDEARACESLGIPCCRPTNLAIQDDWLRSGQGGGSGGSGGQSGQGGFGGSAASAAMLQSQLSQQQAEQLRQRALAEARRLAREAAGQRTTASQLPERVRWNTLASKLADDLRQGRGTLPPQEYRRAIEQYFETISRMTDAESEAGTDR